MLLRIFFILGMIWSISPGVTAANPACERLKPLRGSGSAYKDRGNRCEGLYEADLGNKTLEPVSLTFGTISYRLQAGLKLEVWAPGQSTTVHVQAGAVSPGTHYRMDAILTQNATLLWPVDDVLLPEGLAASRIGVFGWKGPDNNPILIPVRIVTAGAPRSPLPPVLLILRPSFDTQRTIWRSAALDNGNCGLPGQWRDVPGGSVDADLPIYLRLRGLAGDNCLDVESLGTQGWALEQLRVDLPRQ